MAYALAQHIHHTALGDLALQAMQELCALDALVRQLQRFHRIRLRGLQKGQQLHGIQRHIAVEIRRSAQYVAAQCIDGPGLCTAFGGTEACSLIPARWRTINCSSAFSLVSVGFMRRLPSSCPAYCRVGAAVRSA